MTKFDEFGRPVAEKVSVDELDMHKHIPDIVFDEDFEKLTCKQVLNIAFHMEKAVQKALLPYKEKEEKFLAGLRKEPNITREDLMMRLIMDSDSPVTYSEAKEMSIKELTEVNHALDIEKRNQQIKKLDSKK